MYNLLLKYEFIKNDIKMINDYLHTHIKTNSNVIKNAVEDLVDSGGKRIRPLLVLAIARLGDFNEERIIPVASAIEIIHMATLIHDDIIDESKLRRGNESVQSKYGKDVAVFAGDFLFSNAFLLISNFITNENLKLLAKGIKSICEGEIEQFDNRYKISYSVRRYLKRIYRKTALLFAISCEAGANEAKLEKNVERSMRKFGINIGMAFQIADDILDYEGNEKIVGKPLGNDIVNGIYTLPLIYTLNTDYKNDILDILNKDILSKKDVKKIIKIVKRAGGIDYSKELALRYINKAINILDILPDCQQKRLMIDIANSALKREK